MSAKAKEAEEYNGWSNYETWATALWIDNDEGTYNHARQMAREARREVRLAAEDHAGGACRQSFCRTQGTPEPCIYARTPEGELADMLAAWVADELLPDLGASLAADLLGRAVGRVDWQEIAGHFLSEE